MKRFDLLRYPLTFYVAYIHATGLGVAYGDRVIGADSPALYAGIQDLITGELARIAVPLYYFMSAYLFYRFMTFSFESYREKLGSRVRTLLVPYLFWNLLLFAVVFAAQSYPATEAYFNAARGRITTLGPLETIDKILGLTGSPIAYQLWFIRDLIVLTVLAPVVYAVVRYLGLAAVLVLFCLWGTETWPLPIQSATPAFTYTLGAYFGINRLDPFKVDRWGPGIVVAYVALVALSLALRGSGIYLPVHYTGIVVGMAAALYLTKFAEANDRVRNTLLALAPATFFVYASHEPLLTIVKKIIYRVSDVTPELVLAVYLLLPIAMVLFTTGVYFLLRRWMPGLVKIAVGGR